MLAKFETDVSKSEHEIFVFNVMSVRLIHVVLQFTSLVVGVKFRLFVDMILLI